MIENKPLMNITFDDVQHLVDNGIAEGATLELKSGAIFIPKNGETVSTAKKKAREEVAEAIVSLANSFGGLIIIGVHESKSSQPRFAEHITPVADAAKLADELMRSVRDTPIDPPVVGLEHRVIEDPGIILIKVPQSLAAPHGFGRPAKAYSRHGEENRPMSMRDIQSAFWDARTRGERVRDLRAEIIRWAHRLYDQHVSRPDGVYLRVSAIPQHPIAIKGLEVSDWRRLPVLVPYRKSQVGGHISSRCRRIAHAYLFEDGQSCWRLDERGIITLVGYSIGQIVGDGSLEYRNCHYPGRFIPFVASILAMVGRLRRMAGATEATYEVDVELIHEGAHGLDCSQFPNQPVKVEPNHSIGPYLLGRSDEVQDVFAAIEAEVWHMFGQDDIERLSVDFSSLASKPWP